jgi:hypothetical protein
MADIIDQAQEVQERELASALNKLNKYPAFTGKCRECEEPITKGRFCGRDCRDEFERRTGQRS